MVGIMNKTRRRNIRGMVVYMCIAMLFGGQLAGLTGSWASLSISEPICGAA